MWWVLVSTAIFLFFSVYFPGFSAVLVTASGCDSVPDGCGNLNGLLEGFARPIGYFGSGSILLAVTVARIRYLNVNQLWTIFFAVWFLASASFFTAAGNMWMATGGVNFILESLPIEALYLAVLTLYLCFPLEDYERPDNTVLVGVQWLALSIAALISIFSFVQANGLAQQVFLLTGSPTLMEALEQVRLWLGMVLLQSGAAMVPPTFIFLVFLVLVTLQGILRARPVMR